ncbi:unnamed protein product [Adineta steineri]|uniref:Poly [ADP-ribose] polymerase n=1 Tax=Adineta steineri TaxID=433720 RepID=A0A815NQ16_9BILA|nr:unnamed protein product [Adineta steineri]
MEASVGFVAWRYLLPSTPQGLHGTWKGDRAILTWQTVDAVDEYEVFYRRPGSHDTAPWCSKSSGKSVMTEFDVHTGLPYEAYVVAKNWFGSSDRSSKINGCARAPAPTQFTVVCDPTKPLLSLKWNQVSCSVGYVIKRKSAMESDFHIITTIDSSYITQSQDTNIIYGMSYTYMAISLDRSGESDSSLSVVVCPRVPVPNHFAASTPKGLSATVLLNWQAVPNSIAYHIYRRRAEDPIYQNPILLMTLRNPNANSYLDQTVINNVKYIYTIASEDSAGVSLQSTAVVGMGALIAPNNLSAEPVHGNNCIILSWTEVAGALGYRIWRSGGQPSTEKEIGLLSHEYNTKYVDREAKHETAYNYTVQAFDKNTKYGPKSNGVKAIVSKIMPPSERQKTGQKATVPVMVDVRFGDLITENVDAIIVCLSSDELKNKILNAAGHSVSLIFASVHQRDINGCFKASGGLLPCKNIIFVPWKAPAESLDISEQSIRTFIIIALQCAQQHECQTVAFPAVGCGGLGYDVHTVAKAMVSEAYKQKKSNSQTSIEDSTIPSTWEKTSDTYNLRVNVPVNSSEGQAVLLDFHRTMTNYDSYSRIIRIERVQNERWFLQYQIHKSEFHRRLQQDTEQRLFHGCAGGESAVKSIVEYGFNRSLAGTKHGKYALLFIEFIFIPIFPYLLECFFQIGTAYGLGVYFSSKASESHNYTKLSNSISMGERYMFVCKVLVGKTTQGNASMSTCPAGYDSTGNGSTIYVIYHDVQVYAEYLIIYQ